MTPNTTVVVFTGLSSLAGVAAGNVAVVLANATGASVTGDVDDAIAAGAAVVTARAVVTATAVVAAPGAVVVVLSAPYAATPKPSGPRQRTAPTTSLAPTHMVVEFCDRVFTIPRH